MTNDKQECQHRLPSHASRGKQQGIKRAGCSPPFHCCCCWSPCLSCDAIVCNLVTRGMCSDLMFGKMVRNQCDW